MYLNYITHASIQDTQSILTILKIDFNKVKEYNVNRGDDYGLYP